MVVPLPKDGKDGISIVNVELDKDNHIICTMSDGNIIDAGQIQVKGGGLEQVNNRLSLPSVGSDDTLYLTKDEEILYYWDTNDKLYRPISGGSGANGIDFKTSNDIIFDGVEQTFNLPIDNKKISIFINGMYLTETEDYIIDRTVSPNTVTFTEIWEETDLCTIMWINGTIDESKDEKISLSVLDEDITTILNSFAYIQESDITDPWPATITINDTKVKNVKTIEQKKLVKVLYVINNDNKITGCGFITNYSETNNEFSIVLTKYSEKDGEEIEASFAKEEDIDNLFTNLPEIDLDNSFLAKEEDIDNLFSNIPEIDLDNSYLATEESIDNLFK